MYKSAGMRAADQMDASRLPAMTYVEMDPSGRYGRFREILGKGATKTVYEAFDEVLGMEVAWNQVKLHDVFSTPEELQRLYSEVHLLKNLDHDSIMRFHVSWIDVERSTFNFITEMFTSGTLRGYRHKYKRVNIGAIKTWARQILEGLVYLHGHDPPVIHRDLKCDNIFVNGHLGQVKIGDLGLAAILRGSHHAHSVIGTPEFMAPELYEEEYDELVDIYSFGMCMLEMLTCEYPYSECSNPAQIYKKVTAGKLPEAFSRIHDAEARRFVGRCLEAASSRPSAGELLTDPFLAASGDEQLPTPKLSCQKSADHNGKSAIATPLLTDLLRRTEMTITGSMDPEDDAIFLKVQISDKHGLSQARNIYFPFDIMSDTAMDVATEMVKELEITEWEPCEIAEMIDEQISSLVPTWKIEGSPQDLLDYDVDDDESFTNNGHPFYSLSSHSASQASLSGLFNSSGGDHHEHHWLEEEYEVCDDSSSASSFSCYNYSDLSYHSAHHHVREFVNQLGKLDRSQLMNNTKLTATRFCPQVKMSTENLATDHMSPYKDSGYSSSSKHGDRKMGNMTRAKSLVDIRSQLLHRSLVEEISKRRLFNTVGAVENIGYHEPCTAFPASRRDAYPRRSSRYSGARQTFEW